MKFCPSCKRLVPKGKDECPFCSRSLSKKENSLPETDKRRGFVRVPFNDTVRFQSLSLDPQGKNLALEGRTRDVSLTGIYFEVERAVFTGASSCLKVSNIIWMEFRLPGQNQTVKTQGEIRRVWGRHLGNSGIGVMFVNIPEVSRKSINRFLSSYLEGKKEV